MLKAIHRIIYSSSKNIWFNLATEEWLSNNIRANEHILFLWQNDKCVIIGRNQNPWVIKINRENSNENLRRIFVERMFSRTNGK